MKTLTKIANWFLYPFGYEIDSESPMKTWHVCCWHGEWMQHCEVLQVRANSETLAIFRAENLARDKGYKLADCEFCV